MAKTAGCAELAGLLQASADGDLPAGDRAAVEAHLSACDSCSRETARLKENSAYLQEALAPFRMPAEFPSDFLFRLPRKDGKRRAGGPAAAPQATKTLVLGDTRERRFPVLPVLLGAGFLAGAAGLGWLFFGPREPVRRTGPLGTLPPVKPREKPGAGPADGQEVRPPEGRLPPPGGERPPASAPAPGQPFRAAADLVAAARGVRNGAFGPVISRGWDLLAGTPDEAKAVLDAANAEKDPVQRAALVLSLAADGRDETRVALRGFLVDGAPEVRAAAALGLARSLSHENPARRAIPSGPPLNLAVQVGPLAEDPGRAELAARLGTETEAAVRRILVQVLGPTASTDPGVRDRLLDGVRGSFGEEFRDPCLRALSGVQDPAMVPVLAEVLGSPNTPKSLQGTLVEAMLGADHNASAEAFAALLPSAEAVDLRRTLVASLARAGGATAERALVQVLSSDSEASVRAAAVLSLRNFPSRAVLDAIQSRAENDPDQMVRQEAERMAAQLRSTVEKSEGAPAGGGHEEPPDNPPPEPPPPGDGGGG